jgi:plastocyanin
MIAIMGNGSRGGGYTSVGGLLLVLVAGCSLVRPRVHEASFTAKAPSIRGRVVSGRVASRSTGPAIEAGSPIVVFARARHMTPTQPTGTREVRRRVEALVPSFLVLSVGQGLRFGNEDGLCHSFFSKSDSNAFETGLLRPGEASVVRFDRPGAVQVYCSLHTEKQAIILVVPTPHFAIVDANGAFEIAGLAPGEYILVTWNGAEVLHRTRVELEAGERRSVKIDLQDAGAQGH